MPFPTRKRPMPDSSDALTQRVDRVIQRLAQAEMREPAKLLADWRTTAFTTSSEWLGELGLVIRKIQKQYKIDKQTNADLDYLLDQVKQVWRSI